jgi:hypothetical protein
MHTRKNKKTARRAHFLGEVFHGLRPLFPEKKPVDRNVMHRGKNDVFLRPPPKNPPPRNAHLSRILKDMLNNHRVRPFFPRKKSL